MKGLDRVAKGRPILFQKDVWPYLYDIIRTDSHEEPVEGSVVEVTEGEAVADDGLPLRFAVRDNESSIE